MSTPVSLNNSSKFAYFLLGIFTFIILALIFAIVLLFNFKVGRYNKQSSISTPCTNVFSIKPNSVALITGASGGIGAQTSKILHAMGAHVILSGRDKAKLDSLSKVLGERCSVEVCDLQNLESCKNLINAVNAKFGRLDILVCNGGGPISVINKNDTVLSTEPGNSIDAYDTLSKVIKVNLESTFVLNNEAINLMEKVGNGGKIINVASIAAFLGSTGFGDNVDYAAAKAGIISMTRGLSFKAGKCGININSVSPGAIDTDLTKDLSAFLKLGLTQLMVPVKRLGTSEEIGYAIAFLASEQASYVTGANLIVDGGLVAH